MHRTCSVEGCRSAVIARYSPLCQSHRQRLRRFGHPLQPTIFPRDLTVHLKVLARRQGDNADSKAWTILRHRWSAITQEALAVVSAASAGRPYDARELQAARLLQGLAGAVDVDLLIRTCMAVVFHRQADPRRYASDRAVLFTMARMALRLNPGAMGRYYDHKTKRSRTVRLDASPRVLEMVGHKLNASFGGAAAQLWAIEQSRVPAVELERRTLAEALQGLKA